VSQDVYAEIDLDHFRKRLLKYTRRAFMLLPRMSKPCILDVGCGSGVPTIELAKLSKGNVVGIDIDQSLLDELDNKIAKEGLSNRVQTKRSSMSSMDFADESFDIIWAEGAISVIGFERGLRKWRHLLRPSGFLVVHAETREVSNGLEMISSLGYKLLHKLPLPETAHWKEYYEPLETRIQGLRTKYWDSPKALKKLEAYQNEIDMVKRKPREFSSAFYIMQKL
jgi:ubiquinone/menaquinone biosynthesis C-methylase UbiE